MPYTHEMRAKKAEETRLRQEAAGIPDSKVFGGDPEAERNRILDCHVGGVLVRELAQEAQDKLLYQQTDEGIAEFNQGKSEHRISTVRDEFGKGLDRRKDQIIAGAAPWEAENPMQSLIDKWIEPGMRARFLSPNRVNREGDRGYQIVIDPDKGTPVRMQNMLLGQIPEEKAQARSKHYRDKSNAALNQITESYVREGGRVSITDQKF